MTKTVDHESKLRTLAQDFHDAIRDAEADGCRVVLPGTVRDLPAIAISHTAVHVAPPAPDDAWEGMSRGTLHEVAEKRGLNPAPKATIAELVALIRSGRPAGQPATAPLTTAV